MRSVVTSKGAPTKGPVGGFGLFDRGAKGRTGAAVYRIALVRLLNVGGTLRSEAPLPRWPHARQRAWWGAPWFVPACRGARAGPAGRKVSAAREQDACGLPALVRACWTAIVSGVQ